MIPAWMLLIVAPLSVVAGMAVTGTLWMRAYNDLVRRYNALRDRKDAS